ASARRRTHFLRADVEVEGGDRLVLVGPRQRLLQDRVLVVTLAPQHEPAVLETEGGPERPPRPSRGKGCGSLTPWSTSLSTATGPTRPSAGAPTSPARRHWPKPRTRPGSVFLTTWRRRTEDGRPLPHTS